MSGTKVMAAWGRCAICDLEVIDETVAHVAAKLNEHSDQVHPDVQFVHQIDEARLAWQMKQQRMH